MLPLTENDLLFITNGGCVESCTIGAQDKAAGFDPTIKPGNGWDLWKKIAAQDPSFGHPEKFCSQPELSNWESATITTLDDKIPQYIKKICKRDPFTGHTVTGGIVTVKDSSWLLSWTLNRQQQFRDQPKNQLCVWVYGLFSDKPGDYVKKPMRDCTGREICMEWLYHLGVPTEDIAELADHSANTVPVMMPYIDAFFMPRAFGDRPDIVPKGAVNFAFLGQFAETGRDTIFTTEYSMRTGMEAVYPLLDIDRGVPEVWGSTYDVRCLIDATVKLRDGKKLTDMDLPFIQRVALKEVLKKIEGTDLEKFLKEDREGYEKFYENFGRQIGYGIVSDGGESRKDSLKDLMMFYSSTQKKLTTLKEYVERMKEGQKCIYYAAGESIAAVDKLPQTELLKDKDYEVLYLTGETDEFVLQALMNYDEKPFRSIVDGDLELGDEEEHKDDSESAELMQFVKETLGDKIKEAKVSHRLKTHPVCLTAGEGFSFEMEKYFKNFQMPEPIKAERILELNVEHPAVKAMAAALATDRDKAALYAKILYDQANLIAGLPLEDPSAYTDMVAQLMQ